MDFQIKKNKNVTLKPTGLKKEFYFGICWLIGFLVRRTEIILLKKRIYERHFFFFSDKIRKNRKKRCLFKLHLNTDDIHPQFNAQ